MCDLLDWQLIVLWTLICIALGVVITVLALLALDLED